MTLALGTVASAAQTATPHSVVDSIVSEAVTTTTAAAAKSVTRHTSVDILRNAYDRSKPYRFASADASDAKKRKLLRVDIAHDRTIAMLERDLRAELDAVVEEFRAKWGDDATDASVREQQSSFLGRVAGAYAAFERNIAIENTRYDILRRKVLMES